MNNCKIKIFEEDYRDQILSLWQKCKLIKTWNDPNKDIDRKLKVRKQKLKQKLYETLQFIFYLCFDLWIVAGCPSFF